MQSYDCVIIGAGAAGLMCAATAGKRGRRVVVLEHANKVGKKILMSGGGRCNFTNYDVSADNYLSANPHFCKSALARFTPYDFLELVSRHQLAWHEKTAGQLFCDHKSRDILDILLKECAAANVDIHTHCPVHTINRNSTADGFTLMTERGLISCQSLVIATGGLSIPTLGATGFGYQVAQQFGLRVTERTAALVPFTFRDKLLTLAQSLAGVALPATLCCDSQCFKDALLFTHRGISGPAVLQISNYWTKGKTLTVDFLPDSDIRRECEQWQREGEKAQLGNLLARLLPRRFVTAWLAFHGLDGLLEKTLPHLDKRSLEQLEECLHRWHCEPAGTEGYRTAEVTRGGVATEDVSSKTFAAHKVPGLYFIGEVLDVTGWLGGYNFQWAWASGYCAGEII